MIRSSEPRIPAELPNRQEPTKPIQEFEQTQIFELANNYINRGLIPPNKFDAAVAV